MRVQAISDFIAPGEKRTRKCGEVFEVSNEEAEAMVRANQVRLHEDRIPDAAKGGEYKGTVSDPDRKPDRKGRSGDNPEK